MRISTNTALMLVSHCPKVDPRCMHKYVRSVAPSGIFWHGKDFAMSPEVDPDAWETQPGLYDGVQCAHKSPHVFIMFYDVLTIISELGESVRLA